MIFEKPLKQIHQDTVNQVIRSNQNQRQEIIVRIINSVKKTINKTI